MKKKVLMCFLITSVLSGCSSMPRAKIKEDFSSVYNGDDISALLTKLNEQQYYCDDITHRASDYYASEVPKDVTFYKCSVQTDNFFCLHTGSVVFAAKDNKLLEIQQGVYRSKVCLWTS